MSAESEWREWEVTGGLSEVKCLPSNIHLAVKACDKPFLFARGYGAVQAGEWLIHNMLVEFDGHA
jgi:hypothetical protein